MNGRSLTIDRDRWVVCDVEISSTGNNANAVSMACGTIRIATSLGKIVKNHKSVLAVNVIVSLGALMGMSETKVEDSETEDGRCVLCSIQKFSSRPVHKSSTQDHKLLAVSVQSHSSRKENAC